MRVVGVSAVEPKNVHTLQPSTIIVRSIFVILIRENRQLLTDEPFEFEK